MPEKESDDEHEGDKEAKKRNKKHFNKEEVVIEDLQLVAETFGGHAQDLHEVVPLVVAGALLKGADVAMTVADVASNLKAGNVGGALRSAALGAIPVPGLRAGSKIVKFSRFAKTARAAKALPKVKPHLPGKPPTKVPAKPAPKPPTRKPSPAPAPSKPKAPPHTPAKPAPKPSPFPAKPQRAPSIPAPAKPAPAKPAPKPGTKPLPLPVKPTKPSPTPTQPKVEPKVQPAKQKVGKTTKIATAAGLLGTSTLVKPDFEPKTRGSIPPTPKKPKGPGPSGPGGGGGGGGSIPKIKLGYPKTYVGDVGTARAKSG